MAANDDQEEEESGPAVELGEGDPVEGAPLARVASRLSWPIQKSEIVRKEGESVVRTPTGGRELSELLDEVDHSYYATRQEFVGELRTVTGTEPVPTE